MSSVNEGTANGSSSRNNQDKQILPQLSGVVYDSIEIQDDKGMLREIITAAGNTIPNKDALLQVGFRWNPSKKVWWKYADVA